MFARPSTPVAVAYATVGDLSRAFRGRPDAERRASRLAARQAIRALVGCHPAIEIRRRAQRPPRARVRVRPSELTALALSLGHRDGFTAAIAAPGHARVGIDVERIDAVARGQERLFLTSHERAASTGMGGAVLWAMKEAAWKSLQLDGSVGFHELELELHDRAELRAVCFRGSRIRARSAVTTPWPGYVVAAVVLEGRA